MRLPRLHRLRLKAKQQLQKLPEPEAKESPVGLDTAQLGPLFSLPPSPRFANTFSFVRESFISRHSHELSMEELPKTALMGPGIGASHLLGTDSCKYG